MKHEGFDCKPLATGWWHDTYPVQQIFNRRAIIEIFTGCNDPNLNSKGVDIHRSTIHEMLHGLGLGHAYGEAGDFMYGLDPIGGGKTIYTCESAQDNYNDNSEPTEFDTRATFYSYGNDGFARPNTDIVHGINDRYYCEPLPCVSSHVSKSYESPCS